MRDACVRAGGRPPLLRLRPGETRRAPGWWGGGGAVGRAGREERREARTRARPHGYSRRGFALGGAVTAGVGWVVVRGGEGAREGWWRPAVRSCVRPGRGSRIAGRDFRHPRRRGRHHARPPDLGRKFRACLRAPADQRLPELTLTNGEYPYIPLPVVTITSFKRSLRAKPSKPPFIGID